MLTRLLCILLVATAVTAQTPDGYEPSGYKSWRGIADQNKKAAQFGGRMLYYAIDPTDPHRSEWSLIQNEFVINNGNFEARNAILQTTVTPAGVVTVDLTVGDTITYTVEQELVKVLWLNTATKDTMSIADVSWGPPSMDSNVVTWTNVMPGIDYQVLKTNGQVDNRIIFKNSFLDAAVALFDQRADSADIALATVTRYSLTNVDGADDLPDAITWRRLKRWGRLVFDLTPQRLQVAGYELPDMTPRIRQRWLRRGANLYCLEYVKMGGIKALHEAYPGKAMYHNAGQEFREGDSEDTYIRNSENNFNHGGSEHFTSGDSSGTKYACMIQFDLSAIPTTSTVDTMRFSVARVDSTQTEVGHMLTDWTEGDLDGAQPTGAEAGATWQYARFLETPDPPPDFRILWAVADSATGFTGDDHAFSGSGSYGTMTHNGANNFGSIVGGSSSAAVALIQDWVDGSLDNNGWSLWAEDGVADVDYRSREIGVAGFRPNMYVGWTNVFSIDTVWIFPDTTGNCPDGETCYESLADAEAAEQVDLTIAGVNKHLVFKIMNDTASSPDQGWSADAAAVIDGWTTDATHYIEILVAGGARHSGVWCDTCYHLEANGTEVFSVDENYTVVDGIQVSQLGASHGTYSTASTNVTIKNSIYRGAGLSYGIRLSAGSNSLFNTIIYDFGTGARVEGDIYNCTIVDCGTAIHGSWNTTNAVNNIVYGCTDFRSGDCLVAPAHHNATDLSSVGYTDCGSCGAGDITSLSDPFVNYAGDDFHLAEGSDLIEAGSDESAILTDENDIDGEDRPENTNWDIGADEFVPGDGEPGRRRRLLQENN